MDKITTTIRREPLVEILSGRKVIEYREIKPYWVRRFSGVTLPFLLRVRNGMALRVADVTLRIDRIRRNSSTGYFELHIGKIVSSKFCSNLRK